jgi:hypothetical protein
VKEISQAVSAENVDMRCLQTLIARARANTTRAPDVRKMILDKALGLRHYLETIGYGMTQAPPPMPYPSPPTVPDPVPVPAPAPTIQDSKAVNGGGGGGGPRKANGSDGRRSRNA